MPGLPVHHQLPELAQTHVHQVSDAISSSVIPFSSCLQSFPASGSFHMSQLFISGGQSIGVFSFNISPSNEHQVVSISLIALIRSIFFSSRNFNLKNRIVLNDKDLGATTCEIVQILSLLNLDLTLSFD